MQAEWDQATFIDLLALWIIACDQPFEEVDRPEFRDLLMYVRHSSKLFTIPGQNTIRRHVMKLGEVELEAIKDMFLVSNSMIWQIFASFNSLSLQETERPC